MEMVELKTFKQHVRCANKLSEVLTVSGRLLEQHCPKQLYITTTNSRLSPIRKLVSANKLIAPFKISPRHNISNTHPHTPTPLQPYKVLEATNQLDNPGADKIRKACNQLEDLLLHGCILADEPGFDKTKQCLLVALFHTFLYDILQ
jgi:hypothetical protein